MTDAFQEQRDSYERYLAGRMGTDLGHVEGAVMASGAGITRRRLFKAATAVSAAIPGIAFLNSKIAAAAAEAGARDGGTLLTQAGTIVWDNEGLPAYIVTRDLYLGDLDWETAFSAVLRDLPEIGTPMDEIPDFLDRFLADQWAKARVR